ncbi:MAG: hypothetical protein WC764_03555 [Candidatus Paceibacterota bacterium]|jgi:hypothetical protein
MTSENISTETEKRPGLEHLNPDIKPIMACLGDWWDYKEQPGPTLHLSNMVENVIRTELAERENKLIELSFYADPKKLTEKRIKNAGEKSYVISPVDGRDKLSKEYADCTGLVVTGQDKELGVDISFLTHQNPTFFLKSDENKNKFIADLSNSLTEIKERCEPGTIDAVIFSGSYLPGISPHTGNSYQKVHDESTALITNVVKEGLGFKPSIMVEPKASHGRDDAYYENATRRLFMIRPKLRA